ncbi:MAG: hypothetical protein A6D92_02455 [Symbiobacterium thermophilum]|uniref:RNA pseudouridylate synthase n=1 Tax=Symbiobacterium thermophilum TaxID=2734 RepID=A0A1Y2T651_SYMTR|nr:MAG: hypothetical protein A6D92_02455 [Symbiobacterium thermophilum]
MRFVVDPSARGLRLSQYLFDRLKLSRTVVRRAKTSGGILVDGRPARTSLVLAGGEVVEVRVAQEGRVEPEPIPIQVVYEDPWLLVVDKPAGMVVHPVRDYVSGTLANAVAHHLLRSGSDPVARPVQRIDRETSGLVLFAKDPAVAGLLARELERQKLERRYVAVVEGAVAATRARWTGRFAGCGAIRSRGRWRRGPAPLSRSGCWRRRRRRAAPCGRTGQPRGSRRSPTGGCCAAGPRPRCWSSGWRRGGPTRSGCTWPGWAIRCWGTSSTAEAGS